MDPCCPICNAKPANFFELPVPNHSEKIERIIYNCNECDHYYRDTGSLKLKLTTYYLENNKEYSDSINKNKIEYKFFDGLIKRYKNGNKILDVGCNDGSFLTSISETFEKAGVEPSAVRINNSKIKLYKGFFEEINFQNEKFDIITLFDVLEHIYSFDELFKKFDETLKSDGFILLTTPNTNSFTFKLSKKLWRHFLPSEHLNLFSEKSLEKLTDRFNYKIVWSKKYDHKLNPKKSFIIFLFQLIKLPIKRVLNNYNSESYKLFNEMFNDYMMVILKKKENESIYN